MAIYIPAIGPSTLTTMKKNPEYNIFSNEGMFKYGFFLISAYRGIEQKFDIEKVLGNNIRDDVFILGDSGGFQEMTLGKNFGREVVLDWLDDNCTAGMIKDYPCLDSDSNEVILEKQRKTVIDAKWMLENREKTKLYQIYLGRTLKQFQHMHELYGDSEFDGISIGSLNTNIDNIISCILYVSQLTGYKKPLHILGRTGSITMPIMHYMEYKLKVPITYDSSTYSFGSRFREYRVPFDYKTKLTITDRGNEHKVKELPCDCPICSTTDVDYLSQSGGFPGFLMDMHNMYTQIQLTKTLNALVHNEEKYKEFVSNMSVKAGKYLDLIDTMIEEGVEKAIRYHDYKGASDLSKWV